ncbi:uncharacterized protein LOC135372839 [Ornithodoros turicata]|uniref:uncharacterized protein LOC135372839 n=1 Tax=Ornithodoros turicata TaxID=34597 RepID=UPI00313997B1
MAARSPGDSVQQRQPQRSGGRLTVWFPVPDHFTCPEDDCSTAFRTGVWTSQRRSLERHLELAHKARITSTVYRCRICNSTLGPRPLYHQCLQDHDAPNEASRQFPHLCTTCDRSFPSRKGLSNHMLWHQKEEEKGRRATRTCDSAGSAQPAQESNAPLRHDTRSTTSPAAARQSMTVFSTTDTSSSRNELISSQEALPTSSCLDQTSSRVDATCSTGDRSRTPESAGVLSALPSSATGAEYREPALSREQVGLHDHMGGRDPERTPASAERAQTASANEDGDPVERAEAINGALQASLFSSLAPTLTEEPRPVLTPRDNAAASEIRNSQDGLLASHIVTTRVIDNDDDELPEEPPTTQVEGLTTETNNHGEGTGPLQLLRDLAAEVRQIMNGVRTEESWGRFERLLEDATAAVTEYVKLPPLREADEGARRTINPEDPRAIQSLYRRNRRQAVRLIVQGAPTRCSIEAAEVERHFSRVWSASSTPDLAACQRPRAEEQVDLSPFSPEEVRRKATRCENTAPGSDRLTYRHWLAADPQCTFLAAVFNLCMTWKRVPMEWRSTRTILIYKKGEQDQVENWRPISLCRTINKLYTKCLAARLQHWLQEYNVLSKAQKGFLPHDGVFEHQYLLQRLMDHARSKGKEFCAAFLDLTNAFGSVPHAVIIEGVRASGAGEAFTEIVQDLYADNTTSIATGVEVTGVIAVRSGIRQGCPLSGILFNLAIDPVIRAIQDNAEEHSCLAYADDLTPLAASPVDLQRRIDKVVAEVERLGMSFNAGKCAAMHISGHIPVGMRATIFNVNGNSIPPLRNFEEIVYLGKPVGFSLLNGDSEVHNMIDLGQKLLCSMLAPWQRLDAIRTFLYPALNFAMRTGCIAKTQWEKLDAQLRPLIKRTLYLPKNASNEYIYGSARKGACGVPIAAELSHICRVDNAYKVLTSRDEGLSRLAMEDLMDIVGDRLRRPVNTADAEAYLNGDTEGDFRAVSTQLRSVWTEARKASRRLNITWTLVESDPCIGRQTTTITPRTRTKLLASIRAQLNSERDCRLQSLPSQGKVMACIAADRASSRFIRTGAYTRFADWRFVHRARLNLLPVNGARQWAPANDKRCRRCNHPAETLPHVMNHCMLHSRAMTKRHNRVVDRLKKAALARFTIIKENQDIGGLGLRPDLILARGEEAIILDVTCPFENQPEALAVARTTKISKYQPAVQHIRRRYQRVRVDAVVVGALGTWDKNNDIIMRKLCSRRYLSLFKKLVVSDVIAVSRDIYTAHITGVEP